LIHPGTTGPVTVRLPDDLVAFIDQRVAGGEASSRAAVVAAAVDRETADGDPDHLDDLAAFASRGPRHDPA